MGGGGAPGQDAPQQDTSEQIYISSLALLKMLKHGRAGVPLEVMGLMLGEFVDEYTVKVVDVFAMPQSGTGVSVEAVDPVFQTKMLDMLKQVGRYVLRIPLPQERAITLCYSSDHSPLRFDVDRFFFLFLHLISIEIFPKHSSFLFLSPIHRPEMVVGWYHSHPGFGCWLSGVDVNTQQSFEALNARAVSVVIDPIQSVRGKVVIDAFRCISPQTMMMGQEPRQTTSNVGHLNKPSIQALIHGLNRHYYSMAINYRKTELEESMLLNLQKHTWTSGLTLSNFCDHATNNAAALKELKDTSAKYDKAVVEEGDVAFDKRVVASAGKMDAKKRMEDGITKLLASNITQSMGTMLDQIAF